jgi:hypothetical protein
MIKTMLAGDFDGAVELRYDPAGLVCLLTAPVKSGADFTAA